MLHEIQLHAEAAVEVAGLSLAYGSSVILKNVDLTLPKGQTLALLGPSGCGKTTLLRLVAGLLAPTKGSVTINGIKVADATNGTFAPPEKRHLGMILAWCFRIMHSGRICQYTGMFRFRWRCAV